MPGVKYGSRLGSHFGVTVGGAEGTDNGIREGSRCCHMARGHWSGCVGVSGTLPPP